MVGSGRTSRGHLLQQWVGGGRPGRKAALHRRCCSEHRGRGEGREGVPDESMMCNERGSEAEEETTGRIVQCY